MPRGSLFGQLGGSVVQRQYHVLLQPPLHHQRAPGQSLPAFQRCTQQSFHGSQLMKTPSGLFQRLDVNGTKYAGESSFVCHTRWVHALTYILLESKWSQVHSALSAAGRKQAPEAYDKEL